MKNSQPSPPRLFLRFFRWFCHPRMKDYIEGDLMEIYDRRVKESGKRKADWKFIKDVLLLFRPGIVSPEKGNHTLTHQCFWASCCHWDLFGSLCLYGVRL